MKYIKLSILFFVALSLMHCSKDDEIKVETDIITITDNDDVSFLVQVVDADGNPLAGATLTNNLNGNTKIADELGLIQLDNLSIPANGLPVSIELDGWMKMVKVLRGASNSTTSLKLEMYKFDTETTIETGSTGNISQNGQLSLPATLLLPDNSVYTGPVRVMSHYYNPEDDDFLADAPGDMSAVDMDNQLYTLVSYGMYNIELFDEAGNELSIPDGEKATIQFPIPGNYDVIPDQMPLWSMNEMTARWEEEGIAIRNGNYFEAQVSHFSWWNLDIQFDPVTVCMTLVDNSGQPIPNYTYLISSPDQQIAYYMGTSDANGNLCANVPIGEAVAINIVVGEELSSPHELGTFNENTELGEVALNLNFFHVFGTAVDCNGVPGSEGYVRYTQNGILNYAYLNAEGNIYLLLSETGDLEMLVIDYQNATFSDVINLSITSDQDDYDLGAVEVCSGENPGDGVLVLGNIEADQTWTTGNTYIISRRIVVVPGVTLTIEPGVVIKAEPGEGINASMLWVAQGARLMAEGTAELPIVFTSVADDITPEDIAAGNMASPNLDPDIVGLWGGLIVLGQAPVSVSAEPVGIEGMLPQDPYRYYGGDIADDDSGVLRYISIRHGGANIGAGNQINGLTLGGVGSGTTIDHIEIVSFLDDGIEFFGGTVDVNNLLVWNAGDDAVDTDQCWAGTLDGVIVITPSNTCFELDGPEGVYEARHTIQNGTVVANLNGRSISASLIDLDIGTLVDLKNIHFVAPILDGQSMTEDEAANTTFENVTFDVADIQTVMEQGGPVPPGVSAGGSPQAEAAVFNWTWTAETGNLDGL
jgi:hypothetical protein